MNINYQFSDILGSVYRNGNVCFTGCGTHLLSSIGNRIKIISIIKNETRTLRTKMAANISNLVTNADSTKAFITDDLGHCFYVNLPCDVILHKFMPIRGSRINSLKFSPDGNLIAIGLKGLIKVYALSSYDKIIFNPVSLLHNFTHSLDCINCIDWSADGRLIIAGGGNGITKIFEASRKLGIRTLYYSLSERASIVCAYFYAENYNVFMVDQSGYASLWTCSIIAPETHENENLEITQESNVKEERLNYSRKARQNLAQDHSSDHRVLVTASDLQKLKKLLVVAFSDGAFSLYDISDGFSMLQSFRIGDMVISTINFNSFGDWIAIGCGQGFDTHLMVWEWQSETYILNQQSHSQKITSIDHSPDGLFLGTGSDDGKVKIWNCQTSFCIVTFTEHSFGVSDLCFTQSGKVILSASLEGVVRAHDLKRYRNFRTMVAPKQTQLSRLCADSSGEIVMASSKEEFEIYVWSLETGNLLDVLTGHTSLIHSISCHDSTLATISSDKTLRLWNIYEGNCSETVQLLNEGLDVKYSPSGSLLAALCYDSCICLFDTRNMQEIGTIDTKLDIDAGRENRQITKKSTSDRNKSFTHISFSSDGNLLIAGGQSNIFCMYSVEDRMLLKSFKLSINLSLDGVSFDYDYRKLTEFGHLDLVDVSESESDDEIKEKRKIKLPGTRYTDTSVRSVKPAIEINDISFSPNCRHFAVVSTEGVSIYLLNAHYRFDPFSLETDVTSENISIAVKERKYVQAICMALRLNDNAHIMSAVESIPTTHIGPILQFLGYIYAEKLLKWIVGENRNSEHMHFYQLVLKELLFIYGDEFKASMPQNTPLITAVLEMVNSQQKSIIQLSQKNFHSLEYLVRMRPHFDRPLETPLNL